MYYRDSLLDEQVYGIPPGTGRVAKVLYPQVSIVMFCSAIKIAFFIEIHFHVERRAAIEASPATRAVDLRACAPSLVQTLRQAVFECQL